MKNKFISFLLIIAVFVTMFTTSCFATDSANYDILDKNGNVVRTIDLSESKFAYNFVCFTLSTERSVYQFNVIGSDTPIVCNINSGRFYFSSSSKMYYSYGAGGISAIGDSCNYVVSFLKTGNGGFSALSYNRSIDDFTQNGEITLNELNYYSDADILDGSGNVVFQNSTTPSFINPHITTPQEDLNSASFSSIDVSMGSLTAEDRIYLHFAYISRPVEEDNSIMYYNEEKIILLNNRSSYYVNTTSDSYTYYSIPKDKLTAFQNGKEYICVLSTTASTIPNLTSEQIYDSKQFTITELTDHEEDLNSQDALRATMEEQNETSKNIFEKIGDILSYINPFSENFFAYKLVELIINGLKSLFVPSDEFFGTFFTDLKQWFSDRLGFLFYPFELILNILNRLLTINLGEPQFTIPNIVEPSTNVVLIEERTFNFNSILENNAFRIMHNIYLIIVDSIITFGLINLIKKKLEEVETK